MAVDVLIVGAGSIGTDGGADLGRTWLRTVHVIERGRSVGGRLATRRVGEDGLADHGAQFFTVRASTLQGYVDRWRALDLVYVWGTGWSDGSVKRTFGDGHPRYVVRGGMNKLAKASGARHHDIAVDRLVTSDANARRKAGRLTDSDGDAI